MRKEVLVMYNPKSGKNGANAMLPKVVNGLCARDCRVTVYPILSSFGAEEILAAEDGKCEYVVCCGGDGSLNHTINGLMRMENRPLLTYIPSGSTNDFAASMGISADIVKSCQALVHGTPFYYDIGKFNDQYFNYIAAFGAFTQVSYSTPQNSKNYLGHAAYIIEGLRHLPIGQFYTWEWAGYDENGVSTFYVHDPVTGERTGETTTTPLSTDRACTGSAQPKLTMGWNNTLTYKRFSLTAFFQGTFGNKIMNGTKARLSNVADAGVRNWLTSYAEENRATDYNSHYLSDRYLENGSYLRLSTLSLGYDFGRVGDWINSLKLAFTCNNVFTLTGYSGIDPEVNLGGLTPGIDNRRTYPRARTYMLGVNINF